MSLIKSLTDSIVSMNALQKKFLQSSISNLSQEDKNYLESYIIFCSARGISFEYLAKSYNLLVTDTLNQQIFFKKNKKYMYSSYKEVSDSVYNNDEYMSMYMYGLALSAFLWRNHALMTAYFREKIPSRAAGGKYLEVGPGHGFYMMEAMRRTKYETFLGVDISPTSVRMTKEILGSGYFGTFSNYNVKECDFLSFEADGQFDAVVMGEVLEHVENPRQFLFKIQDISAPDSFIYVTTCINAPAIDHIYLFKNFEEIKDLVWECGFLIKDSLLVPHSGLTFEQCLKEQLPINAALILRKRKNKKFPGRPNETESF